MKCFKFKMLFFFSSLVQGGKWVGEANAPEALQGRHSAGELAAAKSCLVCTLCISATIKGPFLALALGKKKKAEYTCQLVGRTKKGKFYLFLSSCCPSGVRGG